MPNVKSTFARVAGPISCFFAIAPTDFGQSAPTGFVNGNLAYNAGAGSLAMGTAFVKVTWVTALGETVASSEASVSVAAGSGAVTVTQPTVPTTGQAVTGWNVYSAGTTNTELLTNVTPVPIGTTTYQITAYGAGGAPPALNTSGLQVPMPSVAANNHADVSWAVPSTFSVFKDVQFMRPNASADPTGISEVSMDCIAPLWAASTAFAAGAFIVINSVLFMCTTAGTTGSTVPTFKNVKGATTTDGSAVWTSQGPKKVLRVRFINASGSAAIPVNQEYDIFQA